MNIKKALAVICIAIAFCCVFGGFLAGSVAAQSAPSLQVSGYPASTGIGRTHDFTVTAQDVTDYTGTVRFTSTDPEAVLPEDYTFSPGDSGSHTFSAVFNTPGTHSITVTDTSDSSITGTQSGIAVKWDTSVTIQSSGDTPAYGDAVTFTAAVSGGDGPTGTVTFYDGSNELGTANLVSGQASYVSAGKEL
ncbi:MAG: Ig-like domain-containing protein, partial [Dehalococcoidales bacterium]|nr:Ig-like domain-containing protein [Dehalococcoidales bacterium]